MLVLQEPQLVEAQPAQPELPADVVVWTWPPGPSDLETNPHLDICLARSSLSHSGHWGVKLPMTRVSKSLPQALHLYS